MIECKQCGTRQLEEFGEKCLVCDSFVCEHEWNEDNGFFCDLCGQDGLEAIIEE